jgi:SAM-dependent methyltransferase
MTPQDPLTPEIVRLAYLLLLGRAPESEDTVRGALGYGTIERLGAACLNSTEFQNRMARWPRLVQWNAPPLSSDWRTHPTDALALLGALRTAWADVPPGPPADPGALVDPSGEAETDDMLACLRRVGTDPGRLRDAFVFGCAGGRVTQRMVTKFDSVLGCDLSPARVDAATRAGPGRFSLVADLHFGMTATCDLWYSRYTLQSYPPPLIGLILERALALLRPGGIAVFQVPTYAYGYSFDAGTKPRADPSVDRHVLPQPAVSAIAAAADCVTLEAFDDLGVGPTPLWRSSVYVLGKRG